MFFTANRPEPFSCTVENRMAEIISVCYGAHLTTHTKLLQVGRTNVEIPSENETRLQMGVHSVSSPVPLFFIINNEALHFVPRIIQGRFYYVNKRKAFNRFIFPFTKVKIQMITSLSQLEQVWRKELLIKNKIPEKKETVLNANHCHDVISSNHTWNEQLQRFHSREIQRYLENTLISMNFSAIHFRSHRLDSGGSSKDFFLLLQKYPHIFRYDTSFHGFRYLVFVDLHRVGKKSHIDIFALLRPFSTYLWMAAASSVLIVTMFLMMTGERQPLLYTVSLLVEQGDVGLGRKSYGTPIIISVWLFASFILRLSYTSSKYSYLTIEADVPVPNSFEECVSDINFHKFAAHNDAIDVFSRMSYFYDESQNKLLILNSTHKLLRKLAKNIYNLKLLADGFWNEFELDDSVPYQIRALANHSNNVYIHTMSVNAFPESGNHYSQVVLSEEKQMVTANQFAYIYSYPLSIRDDDTGVEVFAVMLFGGKRVFRNYELQMFNILRGCVGEADISTVIADEMVGKLEQSGILLKWKTTTNAMIILRSWRRLHRSVFGRKKSMNLVQIAYDIVEFKGVVKYLDEVDVQDDIGGVSNRALLSVWIVFSIACIEGMSIFVWELTFCFRNTLKFSCGFKFNMNN
ncbi:unnamed protein product [Orchesella dallaii]|uniref:Uncharacterized protein n=1 Tax=Orchesella dallaii TaxID=48710 RepID=A0ABP1QNC4_9HEXA